ncbi:hypothetical protein D9M72_434420 [compost metagenome]
MDIPQGVTAGRRQGHAITRQLVQAGQFALAQQLDIGWQRTLPVLLDQFALLPQDQQARSQQDQLIGEQLHQAIGTAQVRRIEVQVAAQALQGADLGDQLCLALAKGGLILVGPNHCGSVNGDEPDQAVDLGEVTFGHRLRASREQADKADAGHRQEGFRQPCDGQQERAVRLRNRQRGDNHGGESTQHEGMGIGVTQQRAARRTERQPQRQADQERLRRLRKHRHDQHRHPGTRSGAQHLGEAALERHAGQRQADDDHRHQGPLRLVQIEDEGQVQAEQSGCHGTQREQQDVTTGAQGNLEIGDQRVHPGPRDKPAVTTLARAAQVQPGAAHRSRPPRRTWRCPLPSRAGRQRSRPCCGRRSSTTGRSPR